jgi:hypothetical protein
MMRHAKPAGAIASFKIFSPSQDQITKGQDDGYQHQEAANRYKSKGWLMQNTISTDFRCTENCQRNLSDEG